MCKYTPIVPELLAATRSATLPKLQFSCLAFPRLQVVTKTRNYQTRRKKRCYLLEKLQYFCCLSFTCSSYLSPLVFLLHCHVTFIFVFNMRLVFYTWSSVVGGVFKIVVQLRWRMVKKMKRDARLQITRGPHLCP